MKVVILSGDTPLIQPPTINGMLDNNADVTVVIRDTDKQLGAGRVVVNEQGNFVRIVEEADASEEEKEITLVNTGIYCVRANLLVSQLPFLECNNNQGEYYLTDVISLINKNCDTQISMYTVPKGRWYEVIGVNTQDDLTYLINTKDESGIFMM